ncbi:MAG TPA: oxalyl-CoA decarboxylase [Myxococcota bacterium]|nr:oxalyl-CoA decarboxylase [Myxococcota bacterium]
MAELSGAQIVARSLQEQGVGAMFGIVGFPVVPIAIAAQRGGVPYFGFRNEQSASYAAGAYGYLTGRPGVCLAVSGPGMIHAIAGLANAQANCWPMLLIGGANDSFQNGMGAFQECPQIEAARPFVKYAARPDSIERLPYYVEQAVRASLSGRPGAVYLDLPNDQIVGKREEQKVGWAARTPEPARAQADPNAVERALEVLRAAERPLVIVGKGAAWARAENEVREFVRRTHLPFLATPMGKGVVPDDDPLSVAPARSFALQNADAVLLLGARLNWILHFGLPPRFAKGVKLVQLDVCADEIGRNVPAEVALVGDAKAVVAQLNDSLAGSKWSYPQETPWRVDLRREVAKNQESVAAMFADDSVPMNYYRALREIRDLLPRDAIVCSEGANTMDIGRTVLPNFAPRHRLDAGTFGTMGVGLGFAIAAAVAEPEKKVVAVEGDSAFGFSGMEFETACRYRLPITFVILNNNGIGGGVDEIEDPANVPVSVYTPRARYDKIAEAFGGRGFFVTKPAELGPALSDALASPVPTIVNVMLNPRADRKPQKYGWLTR